MRKRIKKSRDVLWWLALVFGITVLAMMTIEAILPAMATFYLFVVAYGVLFPLYALFKELTRWNKEAWDPKLGEVFVVIWWGVFFILGLIEYLFGAVRVPRDMLIICGEAAAVWVGTEISKKKFDSKYPKVKRCESG